MKNILMDALKCKNKDRPPIWIMRQAGRYLPEYRALRARYSFLEMCHNSSLIAEVTLLPIKTFGMDAAILFSDILTALEPFGKTVRFEDGKGPIIDSPLRSEKDIQDLTQKDVNEVLDYVTKGIKLVKPMLDVPLIGFSGGPFTIASYLIEGGSSKDMKKTKQWMLRNPKSFHMLLDKLSKCIADSLILQIEAGVQVVQIFDSWVHVLGHLQFREFALSYLSEVMQKIQKKGVPIILFCRGSSIFASQLAELKPSAISLDWQVNMMHMRDRISPSIALQGNLDPDILYADHDTIRKECNHLLMGMKNQEGYIFNLGHGIHPDIEVDAVKVLVDQVKTCDWGY